MRVEDLFIGARISDPSGVPITVTFDFLKTASREYIKQCKDIPLDEETVSKMSFEGQYEVEVKPFSILNCSDGKATSYYVTYHDAVIATGITKLSQLQLICKALLIIIKTSNL